MRFLALHIVVINPKMQYLNICHHHMRVSSLVWATNWCNVLNVTIYNYVRPMEFASTMWISRSWVPQMAASPWAETTGPEQGQGKLHSAIVSNLIYLHICNLNFQKNRIHFQSVTWLSHNLLHIYAITIGRKTGRNLSKACKIVDFEIHV